MDEKTKVPVSQPVDVEDVKSRTRTNSQPSSELGSIEDRSLGQEKQQGDDLLPIQPDHFRETAPHGVQKTCVSEHSSKDDVPSSDKDQQSETDDTIYILIHQISTNRKMSRV